MRSLLFLSFFVLFRFCSNFVCLYWWIIAQNLSFHFRCSCLLPDEQRLEHFRIVSRFGSIWSALFWQSISDRCIWKRNNRWRHREGWEFATLTDSVSLLAVFLSLLLILSCRTLFDSRLMLTMIKWQPLFGIESNETDKNSRIVALAPRLRLFTKAILLNSICRFFFLLCKITSSLRSPFCAFSRPKNKNYAKIVNKMFFFLVDLISICDAL